MELYKGKAGSPITTLGSNISDIDTEITINDSTAVPEAPNLATIWVGSNFETIRYGAKDGNILSDITRGIEGTARAWGAGTKVARFYTAYDQEAIIGAIDSKVDSVDFTTHKNDYATYIESELGEEHVIKVLPNGVANEFTDGKLIKRISKKILQSSDIKYIGTNNVDMQIVAIAWFSDYKTPDIHVINGTAIIEGFTEKARSYGNNTPYTFVCNDPYYYSNSWTLVVPLGTYANLADAQSKLAGATLTYQLATPVTIPLPNPMTPNTREITRLSEQVDKLTNAIIALGGTII